MSKTTTPETEATDVRAYEVMFIVNPDLLETKRKKKFKDFEDFITQNGGKVTHADLWEKRSLAYRIGKFKEGFYAVYDLELKPDFLAELNQHLRLDVEILRHLIISLPKGYEYAQFTDADEPIATEKPKRKPAYEPSNVSIKHSGPAKKQEEEVKAPEPAEDKEVKEVKKASKAKEASKAVDEKALDKKLDEIIGGGDFNL